ncbi:MAG: coiled-coil domain-containing protein [Desulfitobacteriaceae bacterium]
MPRINRIRIINFSYNNDSRHIQDETFNLHGGENTLLSLANGGGKSVLVQLVLQPIVPEIKIQGRSINSFFRKKRLPAYVLIEWKLDGAGGYFLTGIGMVSAEVSGVEDEKNRIKYFTFTSKYTGSNAFDLANIDLIKQNGNILEIKPFKEAREMMAEKEKKDPYLFGCFYDDDGDRYTKRLAEFGIAQDEWKNIIAKINDHEGGLDEIFQKYKNSSQLLNEWIIKTIEKVIFKDRSEARRLEEMLEGLVREVIENEQFILEKKVLDEFLGVYGEQVEALVELVNGLEEQKSFAGKLAALNSYLNSETLVLQENHEENKLELALNKKEQQQIDLEERSYTYWQRFAEQVLATSRLAEAEKNSQENEDNLQTAKLSGKIMQAAGLRGEIEEKSAELSGIKEKLAASRSQYDTDERMRNLEFSLKKLSQETLQTLESALARLGEEKVAQGKLLHLVKSDSNNLDRDLRSYEGEKGKLQQQKKHYEARERDVKAKLKLSLNRNLLGELSEKDIEKTRQELKKYQDNLLKEGQKLAEEKISLEQKQLDAEKEIQGLQEANSNEKNVLNGIERDIDSYEQQEQEIQEILQKFGFDFELRFDRERLHTTFSQLLKNLDHSLEEAVRIRDDVTESLFSLKNGRLHIPEELVALLAKLDIPYDTGEAYLRNQPLEIRQTLLAGNPVLPYALILAKENIELLAQSMNSLTMRRVIPIIAYEDLGKIMTSSGRMVRTGEGIFLVCLYEGRVFDNDSLVKLEEELKQKQTEAMEQYQHYSEERNEAVAKQAICRRFVYEADDRYVLGKKRTASEKQLQTILSRMALLEKEKPSLRSTQRELEQTIQEMIESQQKAQTAVETFDSFIEQEKDYQTCVRRLAEVSEAIHSSETRKSELATSLDKLQLELGKLVSEIERKERESRDLEKKYSRYQDAPDAEIVEGNLADLDERLQALKTTYRGEIELLENRENELQLECSKKKKEITKLGLLEHEYSGVVYDEGTLERINTEITALEALSKERQKERIKTARNESAAKMACSIAVEEVKKLGAESPLEQEDIKGDFQERRGKLSAQNSKLSQELDLISRKINDYNKLLDQIRSYLKGAKIEPEKGFRPEPDVKTQTGTLGERYRVVEAKNRTQADTLRNNYTGLKADYRERNANISNIFKGLDLLWDKVDMDYDDYYLYERMSMHKDKLGELIKLHENQLSNLERDKKDMIQQSLLHGMRFYEEIEWISDHSKVRLQGRSRPVQMLKIELSLDSSEAAGIRMKEYIEECISKVREETRQEKREDEVKKSVAKLMYSRELLNVYLGNSHIPVKVFKIDLNMQNSSLKTWEDAVRENSGGEKFVVYFSVLSALMAYTRSRTLEAVGADADRDSSVLVMDNPFGPISSEHLLNPLFEIAKKHRTQLICLSDLKQNSIMNCFNLIYMLKVRTSAIGNNEYLKFEEIIRDENAIENDEKLEKAIFRVSENKQISIFD